tara:strand:- start:459 stop:746 length:288 start_codon:yes stop_codon:yes gene_type:complete
MKNRATRKLVAKEVPVYLAKYFPQGIFRLRGRGSRKDAALYVALRKSLWNKYLYYANDPDYAEKQTPEWRYRVLKHKFTQDLPLEFANHMTVYLR